MGVASFHVEVVATGYKALRSTLDSLQSGGVSVNAAESHTVHIHTPSGGVSVYAAESHMVTHSYSIRGCLCVLLSPILYNFILHQGMFLCDAEFIMGCLCVLLSSSGSVSVCC